MALIEMIQDYAELLGRKEELAEAVKENNAAIQEAEAVIVEQMMEDDCTSVSYGGKKYGLRIADKYNFKSMEKLAELGIRSNDEKFGVLKDNGLGFLVVEQVNAQKLNAALREVVEKDGALPEDVERIVSVYQDTKISVTKDTAKAARRRKGA